MITPHSVLRQTPFIGMILCFAWSVTHKQFDTLIYLGFPLLVTGIIYNMVDNWKKGNRKLVKVQLIVFAIAIVFIAIKFA